MRQVTHALLTRPPLSHSSFRRNPSASFDLHVLSTPPAFILSQDQTLVKSVCSGQNHLLAILPYFTVFGSTFLSVLELFSRFKLLFKALEIFRNACFCHLLFNYQCSLLSCDSFIRLPQPFYIVNYFF